MREIPVSELEIKPIPLFQKTWGALTAGNDTDGWNSMAIAWGSIGTLWERGTRDRIVPVCNVYVRPTRFTFHLLDQNEMFTVSFMDESHRKSMAMLGTKSGADDPDKIKNAGLSLVHDGAAAYMEDSDLVLICRKIYHQPLDEKYMLDRGLIEYNYSRGTDNFHEMFVGEIVKVLVK